MNEGGRLDNEVRQVMATAEERLSQGGVTSRQTQGYADVRYRGQAHETTVEYAPGAGWAALVDRFHELHRERNGFARAGDPVEVVTVRAEAVGTPLLRWSDLPEVVPIGQTELPSRSVVTPDGVATARVVSRPGLAAGEEVIGPAVIEEPEATTYLAAGERAVVHESGALEVEW